MTNSMPIDFALRLDEARTVVRDILLPIERLVDQQGTIPDRILQTFREKGWLGMGIPAEYGGEEFPMVAMARMIIEIGFAAPVFSEWLSAHNGVASALYRLGGTPEQRRAYLPKLAAGEIVAAIAVTEPETGGSDLSAISTTARFELDHLVLNGRKKCIGLASIADVIVVLCRQEGQRSSAHKMLLVAVPKNAQGLIIDQARRCMGLRGIPLADFELRDCVVPISAIIGGPTSNGLILFGRVLDFGHLLLAASHAGLIGRLIHEAVGAAASRRRFGRFLIDQPLIHQSVAAMAVDRLAAESLVDTAARLADQGKAFSIEATAAKIFATEASCRAADRAVQILGAEGVLEGSAVEQFYRDVRSGRLIEGSNEVLASTIARHYVSREMQKIAGRRGISEREAAISSVESSIEW